MLVRAAPPCFGSTEPSMTIGMLTTIVSTFVIFIVSDQGTGDAPQLRIPITRGLIKKGDEVSVWPPPYRRLRRALYLDGIGDRTRGRVS